MVSSGSSGFWFCNYVVSSVRKVWKLPASVPLLELLDDVEVVAADEVSDEMAEEVVMVLSSNADIETAAAA